MSLANTGREAHGQKHCTVKEELVTVSGTSWKTGYEKLSASRVRTLEQETRSFHGASRYDDISHSLIENVVECFALRNRSGHEFDKAALRLIAELRVSR